MELHQIRYFLALCEELNFTRAAERCHVAQSSLTRAIKAMEHELGGALFHRERANTHLSDLGRRIKPFLEQAFVHVDCARRQAQDFLRTQSATLRLGMMCTIAPARLQELVAGLRASHPEIALQIVDAPAQTLQQRLLAGELDVAIYGLPTLADDQRLDAIPIYPEPFMVVLHPAHHLAGLDAVRLKDLSGEPYLWRTHCEVFAESESLRAAMGAVAFQSERDDWILAMAAAGLGYAVVPAYNADYPGTTARPLIEPETAREIALVTVRGQSQTEMVGALVYEAMRVRWTIAPAHAAHAPEAPIAPVARAR